MPLYEHVFMARQDVSTQQVEQLTDQFKGILDEKSTGVFNGKIYVRQDAQKTNAFQSNNNILLSVTLS